MAPAKSGSGQKRPRQKVAQGKVAPAKIDPGKKRPRQKAARQKVANAKSDPGKKWPRQKTWPLQKKWPRQKVAQEKSGPGKKWLRLKATQAKSGPVKKRPRQKAAPAKSGPCEKWPRQKVAQAGKKKTVDARGLLLARTMKTADGGNHLKGLRLLCQFRCCLGCSFFPPRFISFLAFACVVLLFFYLGHF